MALAERKSIAPTTPERIIRKFPNEFIIDLLPNTALFVNDELLIEYDIERLGSIQARISTKESILAERYYESVFVKARTRTVETCAIGLRPRRRILQIGDVYWVRKDDSDMEKANISVRSHHDINAILVPKDENFEFFLYIFKGS